MNERSTESADFNRALHLQRRRYLREQLDSLLAQTHSDIEIVAVDDCSTDATFEILMEYHARDARVRVIANEVNLGFRKNFARAASLCGASLSRLVIRTTCGLPEKLAHTASCDRRSSARVLRFRAHR